MPDQVVNQQIDQSRVEMDSLQRLQVGNRSFDAPMPAL